MTTTVNEPESSVSRLEAHRQKVASLQADLEQRGLPASQAVALAAPFPHALLWRLGLRPTPPVFQSFLVLTLVHGLLFLGCMALGIRVADLLFPIDDASHAPRFIAFAIGGLINGVLSAARVRRTAKRLTLPPWSHYPADGVAQVFS